MNNYKYIAIVGPTASGKTSLSISLAERLLGEIICCDSVQLYKGFDIGSAKPSPEEKREIPHHLFDVIEAGDVFDAKMYQAMAQKKIEEISSRKKLPILVGGTGLYLRALMGNKWNQDLPKNEEFRKELELYDNRTLHEMLLKKDSIRAGQLHENDRYRVARALEIIESTGRTATSFYEQASASLNENSFVIYVNPPKEVVLGNIEQRSSDLIKDGLINEVKALLDSGVSFESRPMQSIGYREVNLFLEGKIKSEKELLEKIIISTRQYAKRQRTFFKKFPIQLETCDAKLTEDQYDSIKRWIDKK